MEVLNAFWRDLKEHAERNALFIVSPEFDLVEIGTEIAADNTEKVSEWIASGVIKRPSPEQVESWDQDLTRTFRSLIVAPYVLMQELGH